MSGVWAWSLCAPARPASRGVACLEAVPALYAYSRFLVRLFTLCGRATPDARERIYRATRVVNRAL